MYWKIHINFINWWPTTLNISRRPTLLSCALKSLQIFHAISFEMIWQTTFSWKCVASSIRPACNLLAYTGYVDLYFCMSLERSMSCSWTSMCPPRTDLDKQTNKKRTHQYLPKTRSSLYFHCHECNIGPTFIVCTSLQSVWSALRSVSGLQRQSFEMCFPTGRHLPIPWTFVVFCSKLVEF